MKDCEMGGECRMNEIGEEVIQNLVGDLKGNGPLARIKQA
jgi:hypothetical protein